MKKTNIIVKLAATVLATAIAAFTIGSDAYAVTASGAIATGIDVSKYNGNINWNQVAGSGVSFAFIRVGNPQTGLDPQFGSNMRNAAAAGVKTGVYYYSHATTVEQAQMEALQTLQWISGYTVNYPVVYDVEASGQKQLPPAQMQAIVNTYCSIIDAAGYYPMVYSNTYFYKTKLGGITWDKWVAQYGSSCDMSGVAFWQCGNKGRVNGIAGNVDLNYQYKDYSNLIISDGFVQRNGATRLYLGYKMQKGYCTVGDVAFYCDPLTGAVQKGWIAAADGNTYYAEPSTNALAKGVYIINDVMYYFDSKGALVRNGSFTLEGIKFITTADGIILPAG